VMASGPCGMDIEPCHREWKCEGCEFLPEVNVHSVIEGRRLALARVDELERSLAAGRLTVDELQRQFDRAIEQRDELRARVAELERERNAAIARVAALAQEAGRADAMRERIAELERERNCERDARVAIDKAWMRTVKERDELSATGGLLRYELSEAKRRIAEAAEELAKDRIAKLDRDLAEALDRAADAKSELARLIASHDAAVPRTRAMHERIKELEEVLRVVLPLAESRAEDLDECGVGASACRAVEADSASLSSGNGGANSGKLSEAKKRIAALKEALGGQCPAEGEEVPRG